MFFDGSINIEGLLVDHASNMVVHLNLHATACFRPQKLPRVEMHQHVTFLHAQAVGDLFDCFVYI